MNEIDFIQPKKTVGKLISVEVLDKIMDEVDKELLSFAKNVEDMGDSARKIRVSLGIVREIIDKYRNKEG